MVKPFIESSSTANEKNVRNKNNDTIGMQNKNLSQNQSSLYDRLYKKNERKVKSTSPIPQTQTNGNVQGNVIDSRTLDDVSLKETDDDDEDSSSESDVNENWQNMSDDSETSIHGKLETSSWKPKLNVQTRLFDAMLFELKKTLDRKVYKFRAIPKKWSSSEMCDVFITKHNIVDDSFDPKLIYLMSCEFTNDNEERGEERILKEYYVKIKVVPETSKTPKNIYPSIEINDMLMTQMRIPKFSRVTLSTKKTALNFIEKIELILTNVSENCNKQDVLDDFKKLLVRCSRSSPLLINQEQIFKLCEERIFVIAKIYPETFKYCLCDAEILRENKLFISEQRKDLTQILTAAEELTSFKINGPKEMKTFVNLNENGSIVENCVANIIKMNCLNERNCLRKSQNYLIVGPNTSGKTTISEQIIKKLDPYNVHVDVFNCAQNKARKVCFRFVDTIIIVVNVLLPVLFLLLRL